MSGRGGGGTGGREEEGKAFSVGYKVPPHPHSGHVLTLFPRDCPGSAPAPVSFWVTPVVDVGMSHTSQILLQEQT
ncbi:hypothetical protein J6590_018751 [Homalodisca vitripennis]|nr:hypothetical protein J6590_018751 [Homalodisca vitripennis]